MESRPAKQAAKSATQQAAKGVKPSWGSLSPWKKRSPEDAEREQQRRRDRWLAQL